MLDPIYYRLTDFPYIAIIESPSGSTYEQPYRDFEDLKDIVQMLGPDYHVVSIY